MDPKQRLLEVFDAMTEGEPAPEDSDVEKVLLKYGPDAILKMCDGIEECDEASEKMWSEVRWELTDEGDDQNKGFLSW